MRIPVKLALLFAAFLVPARAGDEASASGQWHALLVGCTEYASLKEKLGEERYKAERIELAGPVNDVAEMRRALMDLFQVPAERITALAGWAGVAPEKRPTYDNIVRELDRLALAVKKGDRVLVHMAGHGSQAPDDDGDELDGLDEVFLPADVSSFDLKTGTVPHVLRDDELGRKVRAIRDRGAMVWLLMDCCHSGTMVRAASETGVVMRQIDPSLLGVSTAVTRGGPQEREETIPASEIDATEKGLDAIVAMYAAPSYKPAPEMALPRSGPRDQARQHGLLTYMVLCQLRRAGGNVTFAELHEQVLAAYEALPFMGTVPLAEGDLRRRVFGDGSQAGPVMLVQSEGDRLVLNAGQFAGIVPKTVLAVYEPLKLGDEKALLGGVEVVETEPLRSFCRSVELDGRTLPRLEASKRCPAQVRRRPTGDLRLKVTALDAKGSPLPGNGVPKAARDVFAAHEALFALVSPSEAKWALVLDGDRMWLEPTQGGEGVRFAVSADTLLENLRRIFRAENLKLIAGTAGAAGSLPNGFKVKMFRIHGSDESELRAGEAVRPGDRVRFVLRNGSNQPLDVTLLHLDAHYGVTALWPAGGESPRLTAADKAEREIGPFTVNDRPLGTERLMIIAIPCDESDPVVDLTFLEQPALDVLRRGAESSDSAILLRKLSFGCEGGELTRGLTSDPESFAMSTIVWRTEWGRLKAPDAVGPSGLALRGSSVIDLITGAARDPWEPASDRTTWRGDLSALYARTAPAVVVVRSSLGHGTGFLVGENDILTNYHVAGQGFAYTADGRPLVHVHRGSLGADGVMSLSGEVLPAEVVCWDRERDLALLRVRGGAGALGDVKPIPLADAGGKPGQTCVMIGHPASGLLWTVRQGHVSGVGEMPRDIVDTVVRCLFLAADQREVAEKQLARMRQMRITLSSCQCNPGDSGGPLVDESGRLIAVTFARPGAAGQDKFVYHVHLDEVRAFLATSPKPGATLGPEVPDPWTTGPRAALRRTEGAAAFDVLLAGSPDAGDPNRTIVQQVFLDLDEDTQSDGSPEDAARLIDTKSFDAELVFHELPDRQIVFYDTENKGAFDLVLVDLRKDGMAEVAFELKDGKWGFRPDVSMELVTTGYLRYLNAKSRSGAMRKLRILMAN